MNNTDDTALTSVRAYRYGCAPPHQNLARVDDQIRLAHRYRNALCELGRSRRALIPPRCPCAVEAGRCACVPCKGNGTARHCGDADASWALARALAIGVANEAVAAWRRRLRAASGLYWGSYLVVEQAADAARRSGKEPHFARYDGSGRIAVQIQHGISVADAFGGADTRLRITPIADAPGKTPGSRRSGQHHHVSLRIGSDGRAPVWTVVRVALHRPLPEGGRIKWAILVRDRVGPDFRWSLHLTVEEPTVREDVKAVAGRTGVVAVDLGWRTRPDGVRVGYWRDDAGRHDEIVLPEAVREDLAYIRSIGAIRDRRGNEFRDRLVGWLRDRAGDLPDWLARDAATIAQWRSADRLARLAARWLRDRFPGDDGIVGPRADCPRDANGVLDCAAHVACWRHKDLHLHRWEAHGTAKILGRRDEMYRRVAAVLARAYRVVVIERFHLPDVAGRRGFDAGAADGEKVRADRTSSNRHAAAPGRFRLSLVQACRARGTVVVEERAEWTTIDCASCGLREPWDAALAIDHRCSACGDTWDQDDQAASNLLRRYQASEPVAAPDGTALAEGKGTQRRRFSRRRGTGWIGGSSTGYERSQNAAEVAEIAGGAERDVANLAQEVTT